eukprot:2620435-Rhodomonas_salina.1
MCQAEGLPAQIMQHGIPRMRVFFASMLWLPGQQPLFSADGSLITPAVVRDREGSVRPEWGT